MVAVLLMANVLVGSQAPPLKECSALPSPLRVRMTISSPEWTGAEPTIRRLVEDTWSPAGLRIEWAAAESKWDAIDFWIAVVPGMPTSERGGALGMLRFKGNEPGPMARVSIDAALVWARRYQARLLNAPMKAIEMAPRTLTLVNRVMGYAAAHELGHFVLAAKAHASTGIMRAEYRDAGELFEARVWRLDARNRERLQQRMTDRCDRRAAR